jgi:hypothetical protein
MSLPNRLYGNGFPKLLFSKESHTSDLTGKPYLETLGTMKKTEKVNFDQLETEVSELEAQLNQKRNALGEVAKDKFLEKMNEAMMLWIRIPKHWHADVLASNDMAEVFKEWGVSRNGKAAKNGKAEGKKKRLTDDHILEALEDGKMHYTTELLALFESQNFRISDQSLTPKLKALEKNKLIASQKEGTRLQWWKA